MEKFTVPVRDDVSPDNQASFDALKKSLGMVPNLYAAIAYSDNGLHRYLILQISDKAAMTNPGNGDLAFKIYNLRNKCLQWRSLQQYLPGTDGQAVTDRA